MASMSMCFTPKAMARPTHRNPPQKPHKKKTFRNPKAKQKFKTQSTTYKSSPDPVLLPGGEATTYTRLPPREDFAAPTFTPYSEVKLADSTPPPKLEDEDDELLLLDEDEEKEEEVNGAENEKAKPDYRILEVFDGNSNYEFEDVGDDAEDDDGDWEEYEELGYVNGENVNFDGNENAGEFSGNEKVEFYEVKDDDLKGGDVKEKGVPAVMRCFDRAKIYVKAGDGGNGVVAFRREKFVPLGGPSGGDGGRGGNVYIEVDGAMNSLLPFRNGIHFRAGRGAHGQGRLQIGAKGEDVVVSVAPGTVIREVGKEEVMLELLHPGQRALLLPGGKGGRGNAAFKSGNNKVPRIAENGEEGPEM